MSRKAIFDAVRLARGGQAWDATSIAILDKALDALGVAKEGAATSLRDDEAFFAELRRTGLFPQGIQQGQVDGLKACLAGMGAAGWPVAYVAYGLATAFWETNKTMEPVREAYWLSEEWRRKNLRYYPWYGRGLVQSTWEKNYQRSDDALGLGGALMKNPDLLLTLEVAVPTMVRGMEEGWFTGKKLADTLPRTVSATLDQFKASRPIINGRDKDDEIAAIAVKFQDALQAGGWA